MSSGVSIVIDCCNDHVAGSIEAWVKAGNAPLAALALPVSVECSGCNGFNNMCVCTNPTPIKLLDVLPGVVASVSALRRGVELPLLVDRLVSDSEWAALGRLARALPLTAAPTIADWIPWENLDCEAIVAMHGVAPFAGLAMAGVLRLDPRRYLHSWMPKTLDDAVDKMHTMQYGSWVSKKRARGGVPVVANAVRRALTAKGLSRELVAVIIRLAGC